MEKVCIIGAGASGITAAKTLHERGIPYDCFEMGSGIGGVWRYNNDNGLSAAYRSLHINTSKDRMNYSDFPFPDEYPNFPHHSQILQYFENYVDHFGIRATITFNTRVEHVEPQADGGYEVTLHSGETRHYRAVLVCNGHHWDARMPEPPFPGAFNGREMHSREYREPEPFMGQNVVVLGIGNSGVDIACDLARTAQNVYLATRSGAHIFPKYLVGRPVDHWTSDITSRLPLWMQRTLFEILLRIGRGRQEVYGVKTPQESFTAFHPTVSSDLLTYVGHGKVKMKPNIKEKQGDRVLFEDGTSVTADTLIYATGYNICFPFLDDGTVSTDGNQVSLYHFAVHPEYAGLYFIGLVQPLGAIMPISERQAIWIADLLEGKSHLPDKAAMYAEIEQRRNDMAGRYLRRLRHTIQVDYYGYMRGLAKEIEAGRKRARMR